MAVSPEGARAGVAWGDLAFALAVIGAAAAVWLGTADLPPPRYEPIGSAALPRAIAALMAALAALVAVRAVRSRVAPHRIGSLAGPLRVAVLSLLIVVFVAAMDARLVGFRPAAVLFLFATCVTLGGFAPRRLAGYAAFALLLVFGLHAVFTRLFYIDLP